MSQQMVTLQILQLIGFFIICFEFDQMVEPWKEGLRGKVNVLGRFFFMMIPSLIMASLYFKPI